MGRSDVRYWPITDLRQIMIELLYGADNFAKIADGEIRAGRGFAMRFEGWRRRFVYSALAMYAEFDRVPTGGAVPKRLGLALAWRVLFAPTLFGLIHQGRSAGMAVIVRDTGKSLEVRLEPSKA